MIDRQAEEGQGETRRNVIQLTVWMGTELENSVFQARNFLSPYQQLGMLSNSRHSMYKADRLLNRGRLVVV